MDHIVIPVGRDHLAAIELLAARAASAAGVRRLPEAPAAHVTLVAYTGLDRSAARRSVQRIVAATQPFTFHAHGYGFFTGDHPSDLCLHVPVVRNAGLDSFHQALCSALAAAGGVLAQWSAADLWSPHITLLDRSLNAEQLGAAAAWLARRHHPSWTVVADRVLLTGGWEDHHRPDDLLLMGAPQAD